MNPLVRQAYDDATVTLLRATSSTAALARVAGEEAAGVGAYTRGPGRLRWEHRVCADAGCTVVFVPPWASAHRVYCSVRCCNRASQRAYAARRGEQYRRTRRRAAAVAAVVARHQEGAA